MERLLELFGRKPKELKRISNEVASAGKLQVVIYGNNYDDHVYDVALWSQKWFSEHGLSGQYEPHVCKIRGVIEAAFFGQACESSPKEIPVLVMVGQNIRDADGSGWHDAPIEPEMPRIEQLCLENNVPLIRYSFDRITHEPILIGGSLKQLSNRTTECG